MALYTFFFLKNWHDYPDQVKERLHQQNALLNLLQQNRSCDSKHALS